MKQLKKTLFVLCTVFIILLMCCVCAAAETYDEYIVYPKPSSRRFSASPKNTKTDCILVSEKELDAMLSADTVEFYEPNYEVKLFTDFTGDQSGEQWNLDKINISAAWDIGCFGNDVKVAVIDSGAYSHPDLSENLLPGYNYLINSPDTTDNIGHGTFVSGIIAAEANEKYIDGIACHAKIVPLKCFDNGYKTTVYMLKTAIFDAVDKYGCKVINMSFGMKENSETLRLAVEYALQNDCILVAAVGNDGEKSNIANTIYYPANYENVIGVGAVDKNNSLCAFSQKNTTVDVVAPGEGISSVSIPGYDKNKGTSFSTPHISAMAAIAKCIDEDITAEGFLSILQKTSVPLGMGANRIYFGYGLIDVQGMVFEMLKNTEYFISPIARTSLGTSVKVFNNTSEYLNAMGIVAEYESGRLTGLDFKSISLPPGKTEVLTSKQINNVNFMLWDSCFNLRPLAEKR